LPNPDKIPVYTGNEISLHYVIHKEEKAMERRSLTLGWKVLPGFAGESGTEVTTSRELVYIGINHANAPSNLYCLNCFSKYLDNMTEYKDKERYTNEINTLDAQFNLGGLVRHYTSGNINHISPFPPNHPAGASANIGEKNAIKDLFRGGGNDFQTEEVQTVNALQLTSTQPQTLG
jgi:hypothetical protein